MSFKYSKELLFKEFYAAKDKDIALSKKDTLEEKETIFILIVFNSLRIILS